METSVSSRLKQIGLWIAVLPTAVVSALLMTFPIHWLVMIIASNPEHTLAGIPARVLEQAGYAFFLPFTFVLVGAGRSPSHRFKASVVLACLWVLFVVGSIILSISVGGQIIWWTVPVAGALNITALSIVLVTVWRYERDS